MTRSYIDLALSTCTILGGLFLMLGIASVIFNPEPSSGPDPSGIAFLAAGALISAAAIFGANRRSAAIRNEIDRLRTQIAALSAGESINSGRENRADESLIVIAQYFERIADAAKRIRSGELSFELPPRSQNDLTTIEFNRMIATLNERLGSLDGFEQRRAELTRISGELLAVSSGSRSTFRPSDAEAADGLSSAIRDLTDRLRAARDAGNKVASGIGSVSDSAAKLINHFNDHTNICERTAGTVVGLSRQAAALLETVRSTSSVMDECLRHGKFALDASKENSAALRSIRNQVQESVKRTKRLGERSQELGRVVAEFQDLADRAGMLSLNASLQSSRSSSRADISAISTEVEHLANRTSKLTDQISQITQVIALETKEATGSMEGIIRDVIVGSSLAERSDRSVSEIEAGLAKLNESIGGVADSAGSQAKSAAELSRSIANAAEAADAIKNGSRSLSEAVDSLSAATAEVCSALDQFNITPASPTAAGKAVESNNFVN